MTKINNILKIYSPSTSLILALFNHILTCMRRNCSMILFIFNKIFESDEYSPTSDIFLISFIYYILTNLGI